MHALTRLLNPLIQVEVVESEYAIDTLLLSKLDILADEIEVSVTLYQLRAYACACKLGIDFLDGEHGASWMTTVAPPKRCACAVCQ